MTTSTVSIDNVVFSSLDARIAANKSEKQSKIAAKCKRIYAVNASDYNAMLSELDVSADKLSAYIKEQNIYSVEKLFCSILTSLQSNTDKLDKYTRAMLHAFAKVNNSKKNADDSLSNHMQRASCTKDIALTDSSVLIEQLSKASSTASTQTSSSRNALAVINLITDYQQRQQTVTFNTKHALFKKLMKIVSK